VAAIRHGRKRNRKIQMPTVSVQVHAKVSSQRLIPKHFPNATSAEDAYKLVDIVSKHDLRLLNADAWVHAVTHPESLDDFRGDSPSPQVDAFVHSLLGDLASGCLPAKALKRACKWLAVFDACRKVLQLRPGTVFGAFKSGVLPSDWVLYI
jgi:A49-like RNA polymerase I associated factor